MPRRFFLWILALAAMLLAGCGASVDPVIPTTIPTATLTPTERPSATAAAFGATSSPTPTRPRPTPTGGPSPTSIVGPTRTPAPISQSATPRPNPNAPRIEYFTADLAYVYPGDALTLYWSIRGADRAAIYRLDDLGGRSQLWNVESSGSLQVQTGRRDRGTAEFLLTVDNGQFYVEQALAIPLLCAESWFFQPPPDDCPTGTAVSTRQIEQLFEGGRMIYVEAQNLVYILFADGLAPAWTTFENRYVPGQTPDQDENFVPPPDRYQPVRVLGVIWRASDPVRNRLRLGTSPERGYEGSIQSVGESTEATIYLTSGDGSIIRLEPGGTAWTILAPP